MEARLNVNNGETCPTGSMAYVVWSRLLKESSLRIMNSSWRILAVSYKLLKLWSPVVSSCWSSCSSQIWGTDIFGDGYAAHASYIPLVWPIGVLLRHCSPPFTSLVMTTIREGNVNFTFKCLVHHYAQLENYLNGQLCHPDVRWRGWQPLHLCIDHGVVDLQVPLVRYKGSPKDLRLPLKTAFSKRLLRKRLLLDLLSVYGSARLILQVWNLHQLS